MKAPIPTEAQEQYTLVEYLEILKAQGKILLFSHVGNENTIKSFAYLAKRKRLGVRKGVPDFIIVTAKGPKTVFLELKRIKHSKLSNEQKEWIDELIRSGIKADVRYGFNEAKQFIDSLI